MSQRIVLKSREGATIEVTRSIAVESEVIRGLLEAYEEEDGAYMIPSDIISVPTIVSAPILTMAVEFLDIRADLLEADEKDRDRMLIAHGFSFMEQLDFETTLELSNAAHYLEIGCLYEVVCSTLAEKLNGMTPEEARHYFHEENDYTPEEEERVRKESEDMIDRLEKEERDSMKATSSKGRRKRAL